MKKILLKTLFIGLVFTFFGCTDCNDDCPPTNENLGKVNIYIEGNITNAEAQAQLTAELGTLTENIYVENTTQLTSLTIKLVSNNVRVISFDKNSALETINIDGSGYYLRTLNINDVKKLTYVNVIGVIKMHSLSIVLSGNGYPNYINNKSVILESLEVINRNFKLEINGENSILKCPSLKYINHTTESTNYWEENKISGHFSQFEMPNLEEFYVQYFSLGGLNNLTFPKLEKFYDLNINRLGGTNYTLPLTFNFPELVEGKSINISSNILPPFNTNLYIPNLNYCENITLVNTNLQNTNVNNLLNQFLNIQPISGKYIDFSFGNAPATGTGIDDKNTLIAQGNTVFTN